ncbi:MAG: DndE family protein [Bacteroidia bacterium]
MFTSIKTTKDNRDLVSRLTNKLNFGTENVIARIALAYSLSKERKLDLKEIGDAQGKEYPAKVLFGEYADYYIAMFCVHYNVDRHDKDIAKYVKMHLDDGLELINKEVEKYPNMSGYEFLINTVEKGIKKLE